jgi:hypothetical protein
MKISGCVLLWYRLCVRLYVTNLLQTPVKHLVPWARLEESASVIQVRHFAVRDPEVRYNFEHTAVRVHLLVQTDRQTDRHQSIH